jgi:hypothetical protein
MEKCFFCNKELSEVEIRLLVKSYLRICQNCRNVLRFKSLQSVEGNEKEVSRNGCV